MDLANKLARLNPKNVRFDTGSGGMPELLSTEIAGALSFVAPGLGREIMIRKYWPAGSQLTNEKLVWEVDRLVRTEWSRREGVMTDGLMAVLDHGPLAQRQYQDAYAQRWPGPLVNRLPTGELELQVGFVRVRNGVLAELAGSLSCPACGGRCQVRNGYGVTVKCPLCAGGAKLRLSERDRAKAAGFAWSTFQNTWAPVYDWTYQRCAEDLHKAERQLAHALSDYEET